MGDFLVRHFVKDYENINDNNVRANYGMLSSVIGMCCNIVLFILKLTVGLLANSVSIISDGFNNLSDCANCVMTIFGYKISAKPADDEHPFGHGRVEYITTFTVAMVIVVVGFELFKESCSKIIHPEKLVFSTFAVVCIVFSMLVKFCMFLFNRKYAKKINSGVLAATAKDSINDVLATTATLISLLASLKTDAPIDGIMGVVVAIFIMLSGVDIIRDTVDLLIGKPLDEETYNALIELVNECKSSLGMHDLIVHNYGPGNRIASMHVEVDGRQNIMSIHDDIDKLERDIQKKLGICMTIHMDPMEMNNEEVNIIKKDIANAIESVCSEHKEMGENLTFHDFRVIAGARHTNVVFDLRVPGNCKYTDNEIQEFIDEKLKSMQLRYHTHIKFDRGYLNGISR